ncbi:MAG: hypothetical protein A2X86_03450 [Bdellovibrionales bacterium GWA2_49_15]|nr:MAG: hypothetical protein A2X86_03450 [Bdellovibrionales bacterium GWA2_49_15]HAZ12271.1 hypothetical protein [Bdellovibrionales bacterium]
MGNLVKTLVLSFSFLAAGTLSARDYTLQDIPNVLKCRAESNNEALAKSFEIRELRSEVWLKDLDARGEGPAEISYFLTTINANNGCDNNYDIAFPTEDLVALNLGVRTEVFGLMKFFNSSSECMDSGCNYAETAIVRCR